MSRPAVSVVMPFAGTRARGRPRRSRRCGRLTPDRRRRADPGRQLRRSRRRPRRRRAWSAPPVSGPRRMPATPAPSAPGASGSCSSTPTASPRPTCSTATSPSRSPTTSARWPARSSRAAGGAESRARRALRRGPELPRTRRPTRPTATCRGRWRPTCLSAGEAFEAVGGFYEGVRAAEDTDFSWRLQRAGWRLEGRPRRGWSTATGPPCARCAASGAGTPPGGPGWAGAMTASSPSRRSSAPPAGLLRRRPAAGPATGSPAALRAGAVSGRGSRRAAGRLERGRFLALDALLGVEELAGFALSNRPRRDGAPAAPARVVLVADRFPARDDPLAEFALTLAGARVEAGARPEAPAWRSPGPGHRLPRGRRAADRRWRWRGRAGAPPAALRPGRGRRRRAGVARAGAGGDRPGRAPAGCATATRGSIRWAAPSARAVARRLARLAGRSGWTP